MTYLLLGTHGGFLLAGDPGSRLPIAIGPGDVPLVEVELADDELDASPDDVEFSVEVGDDEEVH